MLRRNWKSRIESVNETVPFEKLLLLCFVTFVCFAWSIFFFFFFQSCWPSVDVTSSTCYKMLKGGGNDAWTTSSTSFTLWVYLPSHKHRLRFTSLLVFLVKCIGSLESSVCFWFVAVRNVWYVLSWLPLQTWIRQEPFPNICSKVKFMLWNEVLVRIIKVHLNQLEHQMI